MGEAHAVFALAHVPVLILFIVDVQEHGSVAEPTHVLRPDELVLLPAIADPAVVVQLI